MATKKTTPISKKISKQISKPRIPKKDYRTQLVVQFSDEVSLPYDNGVAKAINEFNVGPWVQLEKKFPGLTITPLFSSIKQEILKKLIRKAKEMDPSYKEGRFFQSYRVLCPVEFKSEAILDELSTWKNIRAIKIASRYSHPAVTYLDEARAATQSYLNEAELSGVGIGAKSVWDSAVLGSDGAGIQLIDIEKGWTLNHQDLGLTSSNLLGGLIDDSARADGTSVLGIVKAADNAENCIGIAPASTVNAIAYSNTPSASEYSLEDAIILSLTYLSFGDVLLVEAQKTLSIPGNDYNGCNVPVEIDSTVFDAIRLASALGIIVIEPGGDGDNVNTFVNFDELQIGGQYILNPSSPQYQGDSGAIFVSAAHSAVAAVSTENTHEIMPWAPKGERIDCYAWGENISTLSSDSSGAIDQYTDTYGGTSGAAAIIAGAILNMQSMAVANQGYRFSPLQIRNILRNSTLGTPLSHDPGVGTLESLPIYMPNLYAYATLCLNSLPDLYLRDFVGDIGVPHSGSISMSPDVILKNSSEVNPQTAFGQGSGTEGSNSLSDTAKIGQTNYLYFRALNKGGATPSNTKVTVFYSIPSTLLTPSLLNYIGEVGFPLPIPTGDVLTVSNELSWLVPGPQGHYCFVAVISCDEDPEFDPRTIPDWDWDKFCRYIRVNNNVTWRNFNMVEMPSPAPSPSPEPAPEPDPVQDPAPGQDSVGNLPKKGWMALDFISPGIPNRNEKMNLEFISHLPKGAKVLLQMPLSWKKNIFKGSPYIWINRKKRLGFAHVAINGNSLVENVLFSANSVTKLKLFIYIPEKLRNRKYTIAVKQVLNGSELGRLTWQLVPSTKKPIRNK
jgi:hypothetical protein